MPTKPMSIRLDAHQQAVLGKVSAQSAIPKQELIRIALDEFLDRLERGEKIVVERVIALQNDASPSRLTKSTETAETGGKADAGESASAGVIGDTVVPVSKKGLVVKRTAR